MDLIFSYKNVILSTANTGCSLHTVQLLEGIIFLLLLKQVSGYGWLCQIQSFRASEAAFNLSINKVHQTVKAI